MLSPQKRNGNYGPGVVLANACGKRLQYINVANQQALLLKLHNVTCQLYLNKVETNL